MVLHTPERDRPAEDEIEVTPEMIEAGEWELVGYNPDRNLHEVAVFRIFAAMCRASGLFLAVPATELRKNPIFESGLLLK